MKAQDDGKGGLMEEMVGSYGTTTTTPKVTDPSPMWRVLVKHGCKAANPANPNARYLT